jgi:hypothetical protein
MPCVECGESAWKHNGACFGLSYDNDGTAHYYCLDCLIRELDYNHKGE